MLVLVFRAYRMVYVSLTSLNVGVDLNERECVRSEVELVYSQYGFEWNRGGRIIIESQYDDTLSREMRHDLSGWIVDDNGR